jgi:hypothetical protein
MLTDKEIIDLIEYIEIMLRQVEIYGWSRLT